MGTDQTQWIEALLEQHGRMVLTTAWRVLGDPEDAEDVMQEVFLKAIEGQFDRHGTRNWGAFLRVAASRCAIDALRRRIRRRRGRAEMPPEVADRATPAPDAVASGHQMAEQLREALRELPERDARIFALRHFEEMTYEEIAGHTGISLNRIGVILHRSRKRLQKMLEPRQATFPRTGESNHVKA